MREFVSRQTLTLLRRFAIQAARASRSGHPDAIHDLRVSIRRLSRCLRVFSQFYPGSGWKKLRRRLKKLMDACARVRDRDVTLSVLAAAGFTANSLVVRRLTRDRAAAQADLMTCLHRWKQRGASTKWRAQLGLK
jgi:CHAD domain-containing protein